MSCLPSAPASRPETSPHSLRSPKSLVPSSESGAPKAYGRWRAMRELCALPHPSVPDIEPLSTRAAGTDIQCDVKLHDLHPINHLGKPPKRNLSDIREPAAFAHALMGVKPEARIERTAGLQRLRTPLDNLAELIRRNVQQAVASSGAIPSEFRLTVCEERTHYGKTS